MRKPDIPVTVRQVYFGLIKPKSLFDTKTDSVLKF